MMGELREQVERERRGQKRTQRERVVGKRVEKDEREKKEG